MESAVPIDRTLLGHHLLDKTPKLFGAPLGVSLKLCHHRIIGLFRCTVSVFLLFS